MLTSIHPILYNTHIWATHTKVVAAPYIMLNVETHVK